MAPIPAAPPRRPPSTERLLSPERPRPSPPRLYNSLVFDPSDGCRAGAVATSPSPFFSRCCRRSDTAGVSSALVPAEPCPFDRQLAEGYAYLVVVRRRIVSTGGSPIEAGVLAGGVDDRVGTTLDRPPRPPSFTNLYSSSFSLSSPPCSMSRRESTGGQKRFQMHEEGKTSAMAQKDCREV